MSENAALAGVQIAVAGIVRVGRRVNKGVVELGFAHVGFEAVDFLESRVGVDRERVGAEAHEFAVFLMHAPELEVAVTLEGVVCHVAVGQLGQDRAGVFGERVEEEAVDDKACCLLFVDIGLVVMISRKYLLVV